jgi:hypothetical protein
MFRIWERDVQYVLKIPAQKMSDCTSTADNPAALATLSTVAATTNFIF